MVRTVPGVVDGPLISARRPSRFVEDCDAWVINRAFRDRTGRVGYHRGLFAGAGLWGMVVRGELRRSHRRLSRFRFKNVRERGKQFVRCRDIHLPILRRTAGVGDGGIRKGGGRLAFVRCASVAMAGNRRSSRPIGPAAEKAPSWRHPGAHRRMLVPSPGAAEGMNPATWPVARCTPRASVLHCNCII